MAAHVSTLCTLHVFEEKGKTLSENSCWCLAKIHFAFYFWKIQLERNVELRKENKKKCVQKIDMTKWERGD